MRTPKVARMSKGRKIGARVYVGRQRGSNDFEACVQIGTGSWAAGRRAPLKIAASMRCARGKNPRKALANALRQAARTVAGRRGTYHGVKR